MLRRHRAVAGVVAVGRIAVGCSRSINVGDASEIVYPCWIFGMEERRGSVCIIDRLEDLAGSRPIEAKPDRLAIGNCHPGYVPDAISEAQGVAERTCHRSQPPIIHVGCRASR